MAVSRFLSLRALATAATKGNAELIATDACDRFGYSNQALCIYGAVGLFSRWARHVFFASYNLRRSRCSHSTPLEPEPPKWSLVGEVSPEMHVSSNNMSIIGSRTL